MIVKHRSSTRAVALRSAPNKSDNPRELPPLVNLSFRAVRDEKPSSKLIFNNYFGKIRNQSTDANYVPKQEIENLNQLCNQLVKGQEELKKRIEQQEILIDSLRKSSEIPKLKIAAQDHLKIFKPETTSRNLPVSRVIDESGFVTFRPSDKVSCKLKSFIENGDDIINNVSQKTAFPRDIFSRKSRIKPQRNKYSN
jgi:hypothetical protein